MPKDHPRTHLSVRLDPEALAQVQIIAKTEGRTCNDVIRRLLAEALAARKRRKS